MYIRQNINRIHSIISDNFNEVTIKEKASVKFGNYFEISVKESSEVKIIIPYKNIDNKYNFEFLYYSNPLNENSDLISRNTNIDSINLVITDIISNNRFSEEYLKN